MEALLDAGDAFVIDFDDFVIGIASMSALFPVDERVTRFFISGKSPGSAALRRLGGIVVELVGFLSSSSECVVAKGGRSAALH